MRLDLRPPLRVALARPASSIPTMGSMSGGVFYEPKWDGFRLLMAVVDGEVELWSRQGTNLTARFPELVAAAEQQLPEGIVLDGEVVVWQEDRLVFDELLRRLNASSPAVRRMAQSSPASYVAFDVLAVAGEDARDLAFRDRRVLLEELCMDWSPPLNLSPVTTDRDVAVTWFDSLRTSGIEGLVAKGAAQRYLGGQRSWVKVKRRETLDVICGAVIGTRRHPEEAVIGLPIDDRLRIVGRSSALSRANAKLLGSVLREPVGEHPWPSEVKPGALDRFNRRGERTVGLTLVDPMVIEISADVAMTGTSFRHAVRFVRPRPEIDPREVQATRTSHAADHDGRGRSVGC